MLLQIIGRSVPPQVGGLTLLRCPVAGGGHCTFVLLFSLQLYCRSSSAPLVSVKDLVDCTIVVDATVVCGAAEMVSAPQPQVQICHKRLPLVRL